jgi:nucleoside 2-deoxyribosyltransferase
MNLVVLMKEKALYWAGPRCFAASMRHFDLKTISILQKKYSWVVHYPLRLVSAAHAKSPHAPLFGKNGLIRTTCLTFVGKSDIVVAYTGLIWDTGTAREVEYAIRKNRPVLAWSDSSIVHGETSGRNVAIDGKNFEKLYVKTMPFNAMDVAFDGFLELSELYNDGLKEEDLARAINREAREILNKRSREARVQSSRVSMSPLRRCAKEISRLRIE